MPAVNAPTDRVAADVMTPSPRTCSPFSTVLEAVMIFRDADCGAVPIVEDGKPIGVLTDRDVALKLAEFPDLANRAVADVMTRGAITVTPDTPLRELEAKFGDEGVRRLLVVDQANQLVGIVAWADLTATRPDREIGEVVSEVIEQP